MDNRNNIRLIPTSFQVDPEAYQISVHIRNLIATYGEETIRRNLKEFFELEDMYRHYLGSSEEIAKLESKEKINV